MRKTQKNYDAVNLDGKITLTIDELKAVLSVGRQTAEKIGTDANAVVRVGKRKLYKVDKIREYIANA